MLNRTLAVTRTLLERLLVVWLLLSSVLAFYWTDWFGGTSDPFAAGRSSLDVIIAVTMFAIGSLIPPDEIREVARRWPAVIGGTAAQYISMPLLAFVIAWAMGFEGPLLTGILMAGCVPGAMASNLLTLAARGNVSYSVSITTSSTLLSPIMVPLALKLTLGQWRTFDAAGMSITLLWSVVLPVVAGHLLARYVSPWASLAKQIGSIVANLTILWIIAVVVGLNRDRLATFDANLVVALLLLNIGGYFAGYYAGRLMRLPRSMCRALTLEVGMQNAGLGTMLVLTVFKSEPEAAIPTAMYTFGCMFTGTILARIWAELGQPAPAN
jgi:bile acid:Na+ symporter, BASS family